MATIKASWTRTLRAAPYEMETIELRAVLEPELAPKGKKVEDVSAAVARATANLQRALSAEGDKLVAERVVVLNEAAAVADPERSGAQAPDDDFAP